MAVKIDIKGSIVPDDDVWIYRYFGMACCSPGQVRKALEAAAGEDVTLTINSCGGYATAGFDIYAAIKEYEGKTTAHVIYAASAATFPACAADETLVSDMAIFMIHNCQCSAAGDHRAMEREADTLVEFDQSLLNVYTQKTGMSREEIQELMDHDTHMSPQKAIEYGFADGYIFAPAQQEEQDGEESCAPLEAVAAVSAVIPSDKARELKVMMACAGAEQNNSPCADSDRKIKEKEGDPSMNLEELLEANPEAREEYETALSEARAEGVQHERERMKELDAIRSGITDEALADAKYGEHPCDARELAYQAMMDDTKKAKGYMAEAVNDAEESGVDEVESAPQEDDSEEAKEEKEAKALASYINKTKGGK